MRVPIFRLFRGISRVVLLSQFLACLLHAASVINTSAVDYNTVSSVQPGAGDVPETLKRWSINTESCHTARLQTLSFLSVVESNREFDQQVETFLPPPFCWRYCKPVSENNPEMLIVLFKQVVLRDNLLVSSRRHCPPSALPSSCHMTQGRGEHRRGTWSADNWLDHWSRR